MVAWDKGWFGGRMMVGLEEERRLVWKKEEGWLRWSLARMKVGWKEVWLVGKKVGWLGRRLVAMKVEGTELRCNEGFLPCNISVWWYSIPNFLSDNFDTSWIPLMRISCLTQRGQERGRSHLIVVRQVAVHREVSLMKQTTSRVDCICMMTSKKVSALLLLKWSHIDKWYVQWMSQELSRWHLRCHWLMLKL